MKKTMLIVGAGAAGMAAACYGQNNGYQVRLLEKNSLPGGLLRPLPSSGQAVDGRIYWVLGARPGSQYFQLWQEVGVDLSDAAVLDMLYQIEDGPQRACLYSDLGQLAVHLTELAPEDKDRIEQLIDSVRAFSQWEQPPAKTPEFTSFSESFRNFWAMRSFANTAKRLQQTTVDEYFSRFENTLVRRLLTRAIPGPQSMTAMVSLLAALHNRDVGYPPGGTEKIAADMAARCRDLGVEIFTETKVEQIIIDDGVVRGVRLAGGGEEKADLVVSAVDAYAAAHKLIGEQHLPSALAAQFQRLATFTSAQVNFVIDADLAAEPHTVFVRLPKPLFIGGLEHKNLGFHHYGSDPTAGPPGKSLLTARLYVDYDFWEEIAARDSDIEREKQRLVILVQGQLEKRFPRAQGRIEEVFVTAPHEYQRQVDLFRGSYMGWLTGPRDEAVYLPQKHPDISGLHFIGHWFHALPGVGGALLSGRELIQTLCAEQGSAFSASGSC